MLMILEGRGQEWGLCHGVWGPFCPRLTRPWILSGPVVHCHWKEQSLEKTLSKVLVRYVGTQELACFLSPHLQLSKSRVSTENEQGPGKKGVTSFSVREQLTVSTSPLPFVCFIGNVANRYYQYPVKLCMNTLTSKQESQIFTRFRCAVLDLGDPGWVGRNYGHRRGKLQCVKFDVNK